MAGLDKSYGQLYINGESVDASGGKTFDLENPATEKVIIQVAAATKDDVEKAVVAAEAAQPAWAARPAHERSGIIRKWAELIVQNSEELTRLDAISMGRPMATNMDAYSTAYFLNYFASLTDNVAGQTTSAMPGQLAFTLKEPFGVVAGIIPWNVPIVMMTWKVAPAIGAGNAIIIKSSEKAPLSSVLLAKLLTQAGAPNGICQILSGAGESGSALASHMRVRKIAFTGSTRTGKAVIKAAAESNLKNVTLELGGKSPLIICEDADIEQAVVAASDSLYNSGQICIASSRLYVHEKIYQQFLDAFAKRFSALKPGDPTAKDTTMGPLADKIQAASVQRYLDLAAKEGKAVTGGKKVDGPGHFFQPTVLSDVSDTAQINREEIFGPVVIVHKFSNDDDAVKRANDTEYGLYGSVFSKNIDRAIRIAKQIQAGTVAINATSPTAAADMPFGGYKQSGIGRELGPHALDAWMETKAVFVKLS